jgi:cytidine deaminase
MLTLARTIKADVLTFEELTSLEQELVRAAILVRENAQAPYSNHHVGAALLSEKTTRIYRGCNVERASYTQTTHAEQAAIDAMVAAEGSGAKIACLACAGGPADMVFKVKSLAGANVRWKDLHPSCGHCLQIIWENCLGDPNVLLLKPFANGLVARTTIDDAFPMQFGPVSLGINLKK